LLCKFLSKQYKSRDKYIFCVVLCNGDLLCLYCDGVVVDWTVGCDIGDSWIVVICSFGHFG